MQGKGHTGRRAWASREAAEAECVHRFGRVPWWEVRAARRFREQIAFSTSLATAARSARDLDRAAKLLRHAAERAARLRRAPEWRLLDVPEPVLAMPRIVTEVEAARDFLSAVPRSGAKWSRYYLVRWAADHGIRARAADWCLAFIALRLDGSSTDSAAFSRRVSTFSNDAKRAKLPLLRVR